MKNESTSEFSKYLLLPIFSDKRLEMIKKLLNCCSTIKCDNHENTIRIVADALTRQRKLINFNPHLVIQYVKYYC